MRDQLRRSAQSVIMNVAEGLGRWTPGEKRAAYSVARGEVLEARAALDVARVCEWIDEDEHAKCECTADRISAMLWKMIQRFRT